MPWLWVPCSGDPWLGGMVGHGGVSLLGALWVPCVGAIARYIMSDPWLFIWWCFLQC